MAANQPQCQLDEFDRFLDGDSDISRLYRESPAPEPPTRLADAIHAAARQETIRRTVQGKKTRSRLDRLFDRIRIPLVALASTVLVVTVSLRILHEQGDEGLLAPGPDQPMPKSVLPEEELQPKSLDQGRPPIQAPAPPKAAAGRPQPVPKSGNGVQEKSLPFDLETLANPAPEAWLGHIRTLLKQGKRQEAEEELKAFLEAHPSYVLPDDLKGLLPATAAAQAPAQTPRP